MNDSNEQQQPSPKDILDLVTKVWGVERIRAMTVQQRNQILYGLDRIAEDEGLAALTRERIEGEKEILEDYVWGSKAFR